MQKINDLGYRPEKFRRNDLIDLSHIVHRARKHPIFDDGHIVFLRDLPDLQSDQILPLRENGGGRVFAMLDRKSVV